MHACQLSFPVMLRCLPGDAVEHESLTEGVDHSVLLHFVVGRGDIAAYTERTETKEEEQNGHLDFVHGRSAARLLL